MPYQVAIKNNETGEVRICMEEGEWAAADEFWWTEGNMACDCNREGCWRRAGGETDLDITKMQCGSDRFTLEYIELPDGNRPLSSNLSERP